MKRLKTYEALFSKYKVGDYIRLDSDFYGPNIPDIYFIVKIISKSNMVSRFITAITADTYCGDYYEVKNFYGTKVNVIDSRIERKATEDEIENYEAQKLAKKYNL